MIPSGNLLDRLLGDPIPDFYDQIKFLGHGDEFWVVYPRDSDSSIVARLPSDGTLSLDVVLGLIVYLKLPVQVGFLKIVLDLPPSSLIVHSSYFERTSPCSFLSFSPDTWRYPLYK